MKILKLPWLSHRAENKPIECYSITVNCQGTKLASGGLDGKVKVWDIPSIVSYKEPSGTPTLVHRMEQQSHLERPLASMSRHNGVVTSVKFSPDGKYLASGSDDKIVLIWEKDDEQAARPKSFGETEADLEHWTVRKRLVAHENDVQDICWSPDGTLLITVGLDRSIIIWNAVTFERIKRYDIHQSMVKGIVFDPANKFFATASDDRTVRIFRYYRKMNEGSSGAYEFQMEQVVMDPFQKSPLTSYFRRMSWSPDGQHIAVPNATNGPVTSVVIINRGHWATDVSLIGHEAPCEVCSFSPRMYQLDGKDSAEGRTTVIATGGQDRTLAIWSTALTKPLVVARDLVSRSITDLAWTPAGDTLFVSSLDGSITCVLFEEKELGALVSEDVIGSQLVKYGGDTDSTVMPESVDQLNLEALAAPRVPPHIVSLADKSAPDIVADFKDQSELSARVQAFQMEPLAAHQKVTQKETEQKSSAPVVASNGASALDTPKLTNLPNDTSTRLKTSQNFTVTKGGKKRVMPTLVSGFSEKKPAVIKLPETSKRFQSSKISQANFSLPRLGVHSAVHGLRQRHADGVLVEKPSEDLDNDNEDMGINESGAQRTTSVASMRSKAKKFRKVLMDQKYPTPFKMVSDLPEALFSNQAVINHDLKRLIQKDELFGPNNDLVNTASLDAVDESLFFRVFSNSIEHRPRRRDYESASSEVNGSDRLVSSFIEVRNGPAWPDFEDGPPDFAQRVDFRDPTQVLVTNDERNETKSYVLYFPYKIQQVVPILLEGALAYYVLISFDGVTQFIRAESGNYATPAMELGSNVVATRQNGRYFLLLTSSGHVHTWKIPIAAKHEFKIEAVVKGVSLAPVMNCEVEVPQVEDSKNPPTVFVDDLKRIEVDEKGTPFIVMAKTNSVYAYSVDLMVWVKTSDPWYFNALEQKDIDDISAHSTRSKLLKITFHGKQEQIQKGIVPKYIWGNKSNMELKESMRSRFKDLVNSSSV